MSQGTRTEVQEEIETNGSILTPTHSQLVTTVSIDGDLTTVSIDGDLTTTGSIVLSDLHNGGTEIGFDLISVVVGGRKYSVTRDTIFCVFLCLAVLDNPEINRILEAFDVQLVDNDDNVVWSRGKFNSESGEAIVSTINTLVHRLGQEE